MYDALQRDRTNRVETNFHGGGTEFRIERSALEYCGVLRAAITSRSRVRSVDRRKKYAGHAERSTWLTFETNAPTRQRGNERAAENVRLVLSSNKMYKRPLLPSLILMIPMSENPTLSLSLSLSLSLCLQFYVRANTFDCFLSIRETEKLCSRNWILASASVWDAQLFFHKIRQIEFPKILRCEAF